MRFSLSIISWKPTFVAYEQRWHSRLLGSDKLKIYLFQAKVVPENAPSVFRDNSRHKSGHMLLNF